MDRAAFRAKVCFSAPPLPPGVIYAAPRPGVKQTDQEGGPRLGRPDREERRKGREEGRKGQGGGKDGKKGRREGWPRRKEGGAARRIEGEEMREGRARKRENGKEEGRIGREEGTREEERAFPTHSVHLRVAPPPSSLN